MRHPRFVSAALGLSLALLAATPIRAAATNEFAGPPPNLLFQLQKQNRDHPWLRVTVDSRRLDLRAERIDEAGLEGLQSRSPDFLPPRLISWRAIGRIDEVVTLAQQGRGLGFIVGGAIGAGLGNMIGSSIRSRSGVGQGYAGGDVSSAGHGGVGAALGIMALGGLGAWQGARWGERRAHEREWYVGNPAASPGEESVPTVGETHLAEVAPDSAIAQSPASGIGGNPSPPPASPSAGVARACASIGRDDLIRMRSDLGEFLGFAAVVGPDGMDGLRLDPNRGRLLTATAPTGRVTWDRIDAVDKRGRGWRKGALLFGLAVGGLGGFIGYIEATQGLFEPNSSPPLEAAAATVGGFIGGAAFGSVLGAGVGLCFPAWLHVYVRPSAAANGR